MGHVGQRPCAFNQIKDDQAAISSFEDPLDQNLVSGKRFYREIGDDVLSHQDDVVVKKSKLFKEGGDTDIPELSSRALPTFF